MASTSDILLGADTWSDDVALGAAELILQPDSAFTVIACIGASRPGPAAREGIPVDPGGTRLGAPLLQPGDKVFLLSKTGPGAITIIRAGASALAVRMLLSAAAARSLTTGPASAEVALTAGIRGLSLYARGGDAYFSLGSGAQAASTAAHYIAAGERLDFDLSTVSAPRLAAITGPGGAAATLHISELV